MGSTAGALKIAAKRCGISPAEYAERVTRGEKRCIRCKEWKHHEEFGLDRSRPDGRAARCFICRETTERPRMRSGPSRRQRRVARADGQDWCRACSAWHPKGDVHAGLCREHQRQFYRGLYARDPEPFKARSRRRKAMRCHPTRDHARQLMEMFEGRCAYCPKPATTWDHIEPVSKGGLSISCNFVPACHSCNASKGNRDVWKWAQGRDIHDALEGCLIMSERI